MSDHPHPMPIPPWQWEQKPILLTDEEGRIVDYDIPTGVGVCDMIGCFNKRGNKTHATFIRVYIDGSRKRLCNKHTEAATFA